MKVVVSYINAKKISKNEINRALKMLSPDEQNKAARFKFERDRNQCIVAHTLKRKRLSEHLNVEASSLQFSKNENGKPFVVDSNCHFNLSHSHGHVLFALNDKTPLGVDVERIDEQVDYLSLAKRFYAPSEFQILQSLNNTQGLLQFYRFWVAKEAIIKAKGVTIANYLNQIVLDENTKIIHLPEDFGVFDQWGLHIVAPSEDTLAAVAAPSLNLSVELLHEELAFSAAGMA